MPWLPTSKLLSDSVGPNRPLGKAWMSRSRDGSGYVRMSMESGNW